MCVADAACKMATFHQNACNIKYAVDPIVHGRASDSYVCVPPSA